MGTPHYIPPPVPNPPPPLHHHYSYPPPGAIHVDDYRPHTPAHDDPLLQPFIEILDSSEPETKDKDKKKKKKKEETEEKDPGPVEVLLEGYSLQKAPVEKGQSSSWSCVIRRPLPYSQKKLESIIQTHKRASRSRDIATFSSLSSSQQGVINRLVTEKTLSETHPLASWVVVDVQKFDRRTGWSKTEVIKLQVILKRIDKTPKQTTKGPAPKVPAYQPEDVIDLRKPFPEKKDDQGKDKEEKKGKKKKEEDDIFLSEIWPPHMDEYIPQPEQQWHYHQQPPPPPPDPRYRTRPNPFEPQRHLQPHTEQHPEPPRRTKRRTRDLEDRMENIEDMLEHIHLSTDRSESPYDDHRTRSSWSPTMPNITPASTPPPSSPRGSLHRRQSSGYRGRYRGERGEVVVQPAITYRGEREREARYRRRGPQQGVITHYEVGHDDYPLTRQRSRDWEERDDALDRILRRRSRDGNWHARRWSLVDDAYYR